jgi:hypothetical protein
MLEFVLVALPPRKERHEKGEYTYPEGASEKDKYNIRQRARRALRPTSPEQAAKAVQRAKVWVAEKLASDPSYATVLKRHKLNHANRVYAKCKGPEGALQLPDSMVKARFFKGTPNPPKELIEIKKLELAIARKAKELEKLS